MPTGILRVAAERLVVLVIAAVSHTVPVIVRSMPPEAVASMAPVHVGNWPSESLTDWITALGTTVIAIATSYLVLWTIVLAVAAIVAGYFANLQLQASRNTERLRHTFSEIKAYSKSSREFPSPFRAFGLLDELEPNPWIVAETYHDKSDEMAAYIRKVTMPYTIMSNYLDEADDYLERHFIDADVFFGRQYFVIERTIILLRKFKDIVPADAYKPGMLKRLEKRLDAYKETVGVVVDRRPDDDKTLYEPPARYDRPIDENPLRNRQQTHSPRNSSI